jgi:PGF-CTERM protein
VTAEETVPVDNTAPAIENLEIVEPAGGETNDQITVRGDISEKGTNVQFAQAAIIAESTSYTKTKDFENADAVKTALEDGTLKVTFDATAISDEVGDGDFSIGMAAVDEAGNDALVEGDSFTIDTSPPSIQPGVSGLAEDTAVLTVETEEAVTITNLDIEAVSSESESTADRTPASYDTEITPDDPATIEFDGGALNNEDTSFTIDIEAEDAAGNTDTYTLTSSISSYRIEADGTAEVDPSAVNSSFVLTTDAESSANTEREATVVQSTSAPAGTDLADNQIADEFIDVSDIGLTEAELEEADVKIPLSEIDIEGIDDDELTMLYSPDGESDYETIEPDIVEEDGQEYLVATVDGFSQLAPAGVDDEPPTIESSSVDPGTNIDLADDDDSATVTFDYEDALSEIDTTATSVDVSGVDSERVSTQITKSTTEVDVTGLEDGESIGIDITVVDEGGNEANENVSLFIDDSSVGNEEDTDGGDGNTGGGDGSTGGGNGNTGGGDGSTGGGTNSDTSGTTSDDTDDTDNTVDTDDTNDTVDTDDTNDTVDTDDTDNTDNGSTDESTDDSMDDSTGDDSSNGGTTDESSSDDGVPGGATSDDETSEDSTPGFGVIMALVALIAAALVATRRSR